MGIRLPLQAILQDVRPAETGTSSVGGTINIPITIPQDTDNVVVKFVCSVVGGGMSAQLQTTDDGGNTWYGVGRTSVVTNAIGDAAQWLSVPVVGYGLRGASVVSTVPSIVTGATIGNAQPSTLTANGGYTGMPILSPTARIALQIAGNTTTTAAQVVTTTVYANSQSAGRGA